MATTDIMNIDFIQMKSAEIQEKYNANGNDLALMEECRITLSTVDDWRYSTGPVFDEPPYQMELMGFSSGKLLKKKYPNFFEARLHGAYSSGFSDNQHLITVAPSKPQNSPINTSRFNKSNGEVTIVHGYHHIDSNFNILKPAKLISLSSIFYLDKNTQAAITIGRNEAKSIYLYYRNDLGLIKSVHLWTTGASAQSNYDFYYDTDGTLKTIKSGESIIWASKGAV
ncbi:hypothetical protein [Burkholderia sp. BCC1640]|uniref:hypothetical protein n=1 Tax=Burkholderia sp. BCC1640 TaxID=2676294 RepID=UPI00158B9A86|nr:hypothetical protein [Burkholderia sp. BCC1640]